MSDLNSNEVDILNGNEFAVKRVRDIYFIVNEKVFVNDPAKIVKVEIGQVLGFNVDLNLINFTIRIYYHYVDNPNNILADISVENIFELKNLKRFQLPNNLVILPQNVIVSIVSMAISHGRALLLKNTAGTAYQDIVVPVSNASEIAAHFFPYMFSPEPAALIQTDSKGDIVNKGKVNSKKNKKTSASH